MIVCPVCRTEIGVHWDEFWETCSCARLSRHDGGTWVFYSSVVRTHRPILFLEEEILLRTCRDGTAKRHGPDCVIRLVRIVEDPDRSEVVRLAIESAIASHVLES